MPTRNLRAPEDREAFLNRMAFLFFMGGVALCLLFGLVYLVVLSV